MRLLADDLTGALDTTARFTGRLGPIPVYLEPDVPKISGHAAVDLACRDGSQSQAIARTRMAALFLQEGLVSNELAFKKIDSLLRGHWAAELAALLAVGGYRHCILAPAFPEQGRITLQGRQHLVDEDGNARPLSVDIGEALAANNLTAIKIGKVLPPSVDAPGSIFVFDSSSREDLAHVVQQSRSLPGPLLWCGAAGLAGALADVAIIGSKVASPFSREGQDMAPKGKPLAPILALIGSNHPVTLAQIEAARLAGNCPPVPLGVDPVGEARAIATALATQARCLGYFALQASVSSSAAAELIAQHLRQLVPKLPKPASLIAAGGETLRAICQASAADHLLVLGETQPGIPHSRIAGGLWDGVAVISKSGAFGNRFLLAGVFASSATKA